jgi:hypothetical protein
MSVARLHTVNRARKDQGHCEKCGDLITVGDSYSYFTVGFRSKHKRVRCMKSSCYPRPSERESTSKAGPMAAMEDFAYMTFDNVEDLESAAEEVAAAFREYADEAESSLDGWPSGNAVLEERAEAASEAADAAEEWEPEEYDGETDDDGDPVDPEEYQEWLDYQHNAAQDAFSDAEGMWV